jgi:Antitoxin VbhA
MTKTCTYDGCAATMTDDPAISPEEMQRRRAHVRTAIADSRIEGLPPPTGPELEIFEAYIRGEIEAADLVTACLSRVPPAEA